MKNTLRTQGSSLVSTAASSLVRRFTSGLLLASVTVFSFALSSSVLSAEDAPKPRLKEEMRMPWSRDEVRYQRAWLTAGGFAGALNEDPLGSQGGEAKIAPSEGMELQRSAGGPVRWNNHVSWGDTVGMDFADSKDGDFAYAFAKVSRQAAGKAMLSLGCAEAVKVWANGIPVFTKVSQGTLVPDSDQIDVTLKAGANTVLIKTAIKEGHAGFTFRILETGTELPHASELVPSIESDVGDEISIRTDNAKPLAEVKDVTVELVAPGGKIVASKTVRRGELAKLKTAKLAEGPYEARCKTLTFEGRAYATHLAWYKGDSLAKARLLAQVAAKADPATVEGATLRMLVDMVEDRLGCKLADAKGNPWSKIHSPLMEFDELMLEHAGKTGRIRPYGFVRLAYRDEVDGSVQYCRAYLPAGYDPAKKWPLVVNLHGHNPANPVYVRWWAADSRHCGLDTEFPGGEGIIFIEPHGRGNCAYLGFGDSDVVKVISEAKRLLKVDDDRVYLTGGSMGGWGTWNVSTRHPDLFAAIAPVFGGSDYHAERSEEALAGLDSTARFLAEKDSSWSMADSLLNIPIFVHHGDVDKSVNVDYSRYGVRMLQRWGYDVRYHEYPGMGHEELFDSRTRMDYLGWFLQYKRNANPAHVRLRTADLRYSKSYWVKVDQMESPRDFAVVDAEVIATNRVRLDTKNVSDIVLSPAAPLIDPAKPLRIVWNGSSSEHRLEAGKVRLTVPGYAPSALHKNDKLPGLMKDLTVTPFAIVVGTISKDPDMVAQCVDKGTALAAHWRDWQKQELRLFKDTEISETDMGRYSLLLIGGPDANKVSAKFADRVPLGIAADHITIDGHVYAAKDASVQMIYPNPLNHERYVLVAAGNSAEGMYQCDLMSDAIGEWDFVVADGRIPAFRQQALPHQMRIASGIFDANWNYQTTLTAEGEKAIREKGRQLRRPKADASIDAKILSTFPGRYQVEGGPMLELVRDGAKLLVKGPGVNAELLPLSEKEYLIREFGVYLETMSDDSGKFIGFAGYRSGYDFTIRKLD